MPNRKILQAARDRRRSLAIQAGRIHRRYSARVPELIQKLGEGFSQAAHDKAYDLLSQMSVMIVPDLLSALQDPSIDSFIKDEVASLLGVTGDERAREPLWEYFLQMIDEPESASTAALSLSNLGDERVLPFVRTELESDIDETVSNAVAALIVLGELEDVNRLRAIHRRYLQDEETRYGIANAILAILGEVDQPALERTLEQIRTSFADRALWEDIWTLMENTFGPGI